MPVLGHVLWHVLGHMLKHMLKHMPKYVPDRHMLDGHVPEHVLARHVLGLKICPRTGFLTHPQLGPPIILKEGNFDI